MAKILGKQAGSQFFRSRKEILHTSSNWLTNDSSVLEVGCGSGEYALYLVEKTGCRIIAVDVNASGVRKANELAQSRGLASRVSFEQCDALRKSYPLTQRPSMPCSQMMSCATSHGEPRC